MMNNLILHHIVKVGGFVVEYENITFGTIRGSGHFVPSYQLLLLPSPIPSYWESFCHPQSLYYITRRSGVRYKFW